MVVPITVVPCGPGLGAGFPYPGGASGGAEYPGWELHVVLGPYVGAAGEGAGVLTTSTHDVEVKATGELTTVEVTGFGVLTVVEVKGCGVLTIVEVKGCGVLTTVTHDMEVYPCGDGCGCGFGCGAGAE